LLDPATGFSHRVSTDQKIFIITMPLNLNFMRPEAEFFSHILNEAKYKYDKSGLALKMAACKLNGHAKVIARNKLLGKLVGRDFTKPCVMDELRIPLPFECEHNPVTPMQDNYFHRHQIVKYPECSKHFTIEFVGAKKDSWSPLKSDISVNLYVFRPNEEDGYSRLGVCIGDEAEAEEYGYGFAL
jgi:hypothetical protein